MAKPQIHKFDDKTSADVFSYYSSVIALERERQYIATHFTIPNNYSNSELYEKDTLTLYTYGIQVQIPPTLAQGEKVGKELEEKYNIKLNISDIKKTPIISNGKTIYLGS